MTQNKIKKIFIKSYGCQMNVYDSNRMKDLFYPHGYSETELMDDADIVVLNTCHIREKAVEKVYSDIGRIAKKRSIAKSGVFKLVVAGCVAQAEGLEIKKRAPIVDFVVGPQSYHNLPSMIEKNEDFLSDDFLQNDKFKNLIFKSSNKVSEFISIQEGCDKFCSFCVVPYTRGPEFSRPVQEIKNEIQKYIESGVQEIILLGQNVNAWSANGIDNKVWGLGKLINELAKIKELKFIRYMTSHPLDMDEELIEAHRDIEKLMPFLHLPVQSGSDNILKLMNRKHKVEDYLKIIEKVRNHIPKIAISGDFIIGFPGETDKDHQKTIELIKEIKFSQAYSFKYSIRPGTPAAVFFDQVDEKAKNIRLQEVQNILREQQFKFNQNSINSNIKVLVLKSGKKDNQYLGRSPYNQSVFFNNDKNNLIGSIVNIKVSEAYQNSISGHIA